MAKNINWETLAHCDAYAVKLMVEKAEKSGSPKREAQCVVKPKSERVFNRLVEEDESYRSVYRMLCQSYQNLEGKFGIEFDNYGGYRLMYTSDKEISPPFVFRTVPLGFVAALPDGFKSTLSVMTSTKTANTLLLLGPIRFINSDCKPNCEYDFTNDQGYVEIRAIKKIKKGDEILVRYSKDYFGSQGCLCKSCEKSKNALSKINVDSINSTSSPIVESTSSGAQSSNQLNSTNENSSSGTVSQNSTNRRKLEKLSHATSSSGTELMSKQNSSQQKPKRRKKNRQSDQIKLLVEISQNIDQSLKNVISESSSSESSSSESSSIESSSSDESSENNCDSFVSVVDTETSSNAQFDIINDSVDPISSPRPVPLASSFLDDETISCYPPPVSHIFDESQDISNFVDSMYSSNPLYPNSEITVNDAKLLLENYCSNFNLTDVASHALFRLVKSLLPRNNLLPKSYSYVSESKDRLAKYTRRKFTDDSFSYCALHFRFRLKYLVEKYFNIMQEFAAERKQNPHKYCSLDEFPPPDFSSDQIKFSLTLFADGVNVRKSTFQKEIWPIWIQISDLPPKVRMSKKNAILAALMVVNGAPNWDLVVPHVRAELMGAMSIYNFKSVTFNPKILIADLVAKAHLLKMFKFNGYSGCHVCDVPGKTINRTHCYYPYEMVGQIRIPEINEKYVKIAECLSISSAPNVVGVKGRSAFSLIIDNLPLAAPVD